VRLEGLVKWKGETSYMCMIKGVWGSVRLGPRIHLKDYGLVRGIMGGVWFVKIEKGTNVRCVVC